MYMYFLFEKNKIIKNQTEAMTTIITITRIDPGK